jgi:hypothetical protein
MWKHACLFVCALAALVISPGLPALAQDPSTQPLLQFADLVYAGAFRLPRTALNGDDFSHGGRPFTYNPARNSLFVGSRGGRIAEVSIPQLVSSANPESLLFSSYLQGFNDPLEGNIWQVASDGAGIEGILVQGGAFYGTAAIYYDANNIQRVSHYTRSTDLASRSFGGLVPVWRADHLGFVAGYLAAIPPEWQATLGGRAITGQCCTPIAWKTSWGPSAFAINPTDIGSRSLVAATPLLYYSADHPTLGHWNQTGLVYGATTRMSGAAIIAGTRTALFFGSTGTGPACYGNGTSTQSLHGTPSPDGSIWCYDPTSTDKGSHAYPYRYQIWAYDLNEFAAVKEGRKQPWEVMPYGVWPFDLPVPEPHARLGGIAYDPARQMLYLSQMFGDMDTFANRALIHALRINRAPTTAAPPPTSADPTPSGSGTVTALTLTANKVPPQAPGTTITWTATASGGISPRQYKWWVYDGATWTHGPWTTAHTFDWTPTTASQYFRVAAWVRSYGAGSDQPEKSAESYFAISGTAAPAPAPAPPPPTATATSVSLTSDKAAPQAPGTAITFTAAPTGGVAPHQYWWWVYDGSSWIANGSWTTSRTFTWQPATANANYRVAVWVRSAGSTGTYETSTERHYAISGTAVTPPPTAPAPTARVRPHRQPPGAAGAGHRDHLDGRGRRRRRAASIPVVDLQRFELAGGHGVDRGEHLHVAADHRQCQLPRGRVGEERRQHRHLRGRHRAQLRHLRHRHHRAAARHPHAHGPGHGGHHQGQSGAAAIRRHHHYLDRGRHRRRGAAPVPVVDLRRQHVDLDPVDHLQHVRVEADQGPLRIPGGGVGAQRRQHRQPRGGHRAVFRHLDAVNRAGLRATSRSQKNGSSEDHQSLPSFRSSVRAASLKKTRRREGPRVPSDLPFFCARGFESSVDRHDRPERGCATRAGLRARPYERAVSACAPRSAPCRPD